MSSKGMADGDRKFSDKIFEADGAEDLLTPMGITSENVAEKYGIGVGLGVVCLCECECMGVCVYV